MLGKSKVQAYHYAIQPTADGYMPRGMGNGTAGTRMVAGTPKSDSNSLSVFQRVEQVIERIRPAVQSDGGDVELVEVTQDGIARIRLHGACVGCPSSSMTLHMGIERNIQEKVPEVVAVEQVH